MVEKIPHRMTLRDLLIHTEKMTRDITEIGAQPVHAEGDRVPRPVPHRAEEEPVSDDRTPSTTRPIGSR